MSMTAAADSIHPASTSTDQPHYWGKLSATVASRKDLSPSDKMVLVAISIIARGKPGPVYATQRQIADAAGLSVRTARRSIEALVKKGLIDWDASSHVFTIRVRLRGEQRAETIPFPAAKSSPSQRPSCPLPSGQVVPSPAPALRGTRGYEREREERDYFDDDVLGSATQPEKIHAFASSSFPDLSPSIPIRTAPGRLPRIPLASAMPALTPRVPRIDPMMAVSGPAIDLALFSALVARAAALMHVSPDVARETLLGLVREFGRKADRAGLVFGLWWLADVMDSGEKRGRKEGKLPVKDWRGYLATGLRNKLESGGMAEPAPLPPKPKPPAAPPPRASSSRDPDKPARPGYLAELRKAYDAGDPARIAALEAEGGGGA